MREFTIAEATEDFDTVLDAAQSEPIVIRAGRRDLAVVLSPSRYEQLRKIAVAELQPGCDRIAAKAAEQGMTEDVLNDLLADEG